MARLQVFAVALLISVGAHGQSVWDLERCLGHAMEHALAVQDALLAAERAETGELLARGAFLPNLNGTASHGYNVGQSIDPFTNQFASTRIRSNSFGLSTGVVLFNGFQNHLNLRRARLGIDLAQATADQVRNEIALAVASTYLNAVFQHELVRLAALNVAATQRQVDRIGRLVTNGAAAEGDLAEVRARLASDKANEVAALNAQALAELALVQLLQLDTDAARDFTLAIPREESLSPDALPASADAAVAHALSSFPQARRADLTWEDAGYARDVARAQQLPQLFASYSMGTGYSGAQQTGVGTAEVVTFPIGVVEGTGAIVYSGAEVYPDYAPVPFLDQIADNRRQSLFFTLNVPIFNNLSRKSDIARAEVDVRSAAIAREQVRTTLRNEVETAFADARAADATLTARTEAQLAADLAFAQAEKRFEAGALDAFAYADARTRRDAAAVDRLRAFYDAVFTSKILSFYLGRPLTL
jgi:outer membrane protein